MTAPDTAPPRGGDELSTAERRLLDAVATGIVADVRAGDPALDDPAGGAAWGAERTVRAELLVELLTADGASGSGAAPRAVRLRGARVTGTLDLEGAELRRPLLLDGCRIDEPVELCEAIAPAIRLPGCALPALTGDRLRTLGNLELNRGCTVAGEVRLAGARIGGQLSLDAARLTNPGGRALLGDGMTAESIGCRGGLTVEGEINLVGARVEGGLSFDGARLANPGGRALDATRLSVGGDLHARHDFAADGEVRLSGAHVAGELCFDGARLANPGGRALTAERLVVEQDLLCRDGFTAEGEIRLPRARVAGFLDLDGARLDNAGGTALFADGLAVDQGMVGRDGFTAHGEVRLVEAHAGYLDLSGATIINPGRQALIALRLTVDHNMFCRYGFTAEGEVRLVGAHIGDRLSLIDSCLVNPGGLALDLERASADILILRPRRRPDGGVDLTNMTVRAFGDDPATWADVMLLRGFRYETLENDEVDVRTRLRWLARGQGAYNMSPYDRLSAAAYRDEGREAAARHAASIKVQLLSGAASGYTPQVYDQLGAAYQRAGRDEAARRVAIAKQWRRRGALGPLGKVLNWLLYLTVGYGYRTWLAALWLAGFVACGTWIFDGAYPGNMVRADSAGPAFHALAYTLDVLVPIVDLGQQHTWQPQGAAMYWTWAFMAAGWLLTSAVAAGLSGLARWTRS
ncbi:MAG TPA: hypothetical protein VF069_04825 [Streptosporangiaceae bacterium]